MRRIDRDVRPLFVSTQPVAGGLVNEYPFVRQGWSDNQLGDLWLGAKINLTSQWRQQPAAFAVRGMIKLPTAKNRRRRGRHRARWTSPSTRIVSKEVNQRVEVSGYGGFIFRGDPDGIDLANGLRWGVGVGVPSRKSLRFTGGTARGTLSERLGDDCEPADAAGGGGREPPPLVDRSELAGECDVRADVAGEERRVCGGRDQLEPAHGQPQ